MSDNNTAIDLTEAVDFDFPEGLRKASAALDFLPDEESRVALLTAFINSISLL